MGWLIVAISLLCGCDCWDICDTYDSHDTCKHSRATHPLSLNLRGAIVTLVEISFLQTLIAGLAQPR